MSMQKDDLYKGQDINITYNGKQLLIAEGSGDNLTGEDMDEGYVDYFNLELYDPNVKCKFYPDMLDTIGGGFMMRDKLIADEFYGKTVEDVINFIFAENGDIDAFELMATSVPEYEFIEDAREIQQAG